jgi:hypothetical protein
MAPMLGLRLGNLRGTYVQPRANMYNLCGICVSYVRPCGTWVRLVHMAPRLDLGQVAPILT